MTPSETFPLAALLAEQVEGFVRFYQEAYKLSREDAEAKARSNIEFDRRTAINGPPEHVSWITLGRLAEEDPIAYEEAWIRLKLFALHELESGFRAAKAVSLGFDFGPYDRAKFIVMRTAICEEWNPLTGSESMLCDMLAQIQLGWEAWLGRHMMQLSIGITRERSLRMAEDADVNAYVPPRLSEAEAYEESALMMERFQRMFLRVVRALRELKRGSPNLVVHQAQQVNLADKQVNVAAETK